MVAEKTACDVRTIQSQLMVDALTCGQQDEYNRFVQSHQGELSGAYQKITSHSARLYGSAGEQQRDAYITDLANAKSMDAARQGAAFCGNVKLTVLQSLTSRSSDEM